VTPVWHNTVCAQLLRRADSFDDYKDEETDNDKRVLPENVVTRRSSLD